MCTKGKEKVNTHADTDTHIHTHARARACTLRILSTHLQYKKPGLLAEMSDSINEQKMYNKSLKHFVVSESKEVQKTANQNNNGIYKVNIVTN